MATASYDHHIVIYAATSSALPPPPTEDEIPLDDTDHRSLACEPGLQYTEVHRIQVEAQPRSNSLPPKFNLVNIYNTIFSSALLSPFTFRIVSA